MDKMNYPISCYFFMEGKISIFILNIFTFPFKKT